MLQQLRLQTCFEVKSTVGAQLFYRKLSVKFFWLVSIRRKLHAEREKFFVSLQYLVLCVQRSREILMETSI